MKKLLVAALAVAFCADAAFHSPVLAADIPKEWREPVKPFHIIGNVYYVGMKGIAAYLITSDSGSVLLDGTLSENAATIERNIEALGFKVGDVKFLINSHAHYDHAAGLAKLKADSGAKLIASKADRWALEHGTQVGDTSYAHVAYPPVKVDRSFAATTRIDLGDIHLEGIVTPGHTTGCTTWSLQTVEKGRPLGVVFPCGLTVAGNRLVGNKAYPGIVKDFRKTFGMLEGMKADVVLTGHPEQSDLWARRAKAEAGDPDAYIDSGMLRRLVVSYRADFEKQLASAKN